MTLVLVDPKTQQAVKTPYLVRIPGWTLERYLAEAPEMAYWEFVRGEVIMHSPVRAEHQDLVRFLTVVLHMYVLRRWPGARVLTGPAAVQILPDVVREPDVFVLAPEDAAKAHGVPIQARPVLVVEVVSPSTRTLDTVEKTHDYALAGVPEYWVVDRERRTFYFHVLEGERYRVRILQQGEIASRVLPGFRLDVALLWQHPLPSEWDVLNRLLAEPPGA